jgi:hypothetical protein
MNESQNFFNKIRKEGRGKTTRKRHKIRTLIFPMTHPFSYFLGV